MAARILFRNICRSREMRSNVVASLRHNEPVFHRSAHQEPQSPRTSPSPPNSTLQSSTLSPSTPQTPLTQHPVGSSSYPNPPSQSQPTQQQKLQVTVVSRYMKYLDLYTKILDRKFPSAMHVYRVFTAGIKEFYRDMVRYLKLLRKVGWDPEVLQQLSRKDLELFLTMPKDMVRIAPFLIISSLPFANYVVFPLAYKYPRQLLCSHFWTPDQRVEFAVLSQRKRLLNQRGVFRALQLQLESKAVRRDPEVYKMWSHVLAQLGSGGHPRPEVILRCLPLFQGDPYHLDYMVPTHINGLLRLHGKHTLWRRRRRLAEHACMLHEIDLAIVREGGVECMSLDEMHWACVLRGLNPVNMRKDDLCMWLSQWVKISEQIDESSLSLLLHCPILLAYNKPSNWALFH